MNRRSFLKRAAQAAAAVSAAAVVGREAPRITGRSETYAYADEAQDWPSDYDWLIARPKLSIGGGTKWYETAYSHLTEQSVPDVPLRGGGGIYSHSAVMFIDSYQYREVRL